MADQEPKKFIVPTTGAKTLPAEQILTGRGFITGKSGSGKSNTMSVIAEELLDGNHNMLIVDTDGEYFGLKEKYQLLHVGTDDFCDVQIGAEHAEKIAEIALMHNLPVILDVSGFLDSDEAEELIYRVIKNLLQLEKQHRIPFLLVIEELQTYLPQKGGKTDLSNLIITVAKRGRKHGLGVCGLSQRPSSVDKDFITQCDWMVWHRATWSNDISTVGDVLGADYQEEIKQLDDGEAFLMTDWDEELERVQFRKKKTYDAGGTPGLGEGSRDRPDLKEINDTVIQELLDGNEEADVSLNESNSLHYDLPEQESQSEDEESEEEATDEEISEEKETDEQTEREIKPSQDTDSRTNVEEESPNKIDLNDELNLVIDSLEEGSIESDDPEELREMLRAERRERELLEDEVNELKTIIENIRRDGQQQDEEATKNSNDLRTTALLEEEQSDGPAGFLVEAGLMFTYLVLRVIDGLKEMVRRVTGGAQSTPSRPGPVDGYPIEPNRMNASQNDTWKKVRWGLVGLLLGLCVVLVVLIWAYG